MASDALCIGDHICLYSEEVYGFIYSYQSSTIHSELAVEPRQSREKPKVPQPHAISFEVCVGNRYKLNKKYRKLRSKAEASPDDLTLKTHGTQASIGAEAENDDNVAEQKRQRGKKVLYGQIIQLKHVFTGNFIHVSTTQTSATETSSMQVFLSKYNLKHAQFRIMPRYKVKAEGDIVQSDDQIVLESVKSPGQYLHVSKGHFGSLNVYAHSHELNLSVKQSGITIYRRYKPEKRHHNLVKAGDLVRFFHKEIEAYLVAEGLFDDQLSEDVHLRVRQVDQANPKTLFPSSSAITYWQVEMVDGVLCGDVVKWEQQCRLKHMTTRKYLIIDGKKVGLTDDHLDPKAVFRLHPVIKEMQEIAYETYCRIEHVVTGTWLHALTEDQKGKQDVAGSDNEMSMAGLQWSSAVTKKIGVSGEMQYDDAFTIQVVEDDLESNFNWMAGMVPFLQKLINDRKSTHTLNAKQTHAILTALGEMKTFMIINSVPNKNRQKLLRNLRVVELLVKLLQSPIRGTQDQHLMAKVLVECYDVLYTYLMGDSRKNELYIAKHIDFFQSQISFEGAIGLNAAHMVMELVKDNRKIVDRITHRHIDHFVDLLKKNKNYRYLDLLSVLCVCDGVSIPDNQEYITKTWLCDDNKNCVYHTEMGGAINRDPQIVYVSKNNRRTWTALPDFMALFGEQALRELQEQQYSLAAPKSSNKNKDLQLDEEFLFLDHQLDLFGKLCYGRNEFAIKVITEDLGYLTWNEAFTCLTSDQLPDQLRAKYCHLIIGLFVDVGENASVLDRINLTFVYDEVGAERTTQDDADAAARARSTTQKYFPHLRDWISKFLDDNKDMTASLIGHNMLIEQVLRLVHFLVKYGYYGDREDINQMLGPLVKLLDGRNDKPYPHQVGQTDLHDMIRNYGTKSGAPILEDVLRKYRTVLRYKESPETKAIVDAKYQAMQVVDLILNYRFNTRLETFVDEFKMTFAKSRHMESGHIDLGKLLYEDYDIHDNYGTNHAAVKKLREIFDESAFFKGLDIQDILLDSSHYQYDKMVVQSMSLLNRYYSSHDNLFKRAVQAQVLITESSCEKLKKLRQMLPVMQRLTSAKMTLEQTKTMGDILDQLISFCCLDNEPEERHPMNQSILYNHGILATVFDILSQEIDIKLLQQYSGIRSIFQKCFRLLKVMARGNEVIQQRLIDRLDMLLNIKGAESEMAEALTEVFTGNKQTCLKILSYQVQKIMSLAAHHTHKAPEFLDLLNAVVKVEELNLPLKRNQGYVMKYFMQYRTEVAYIIDQPEENRYQLLKSAPCVDQDYLVSLVDLLATCAEGENRFIESICQTIFSVKELLTILNSPDITNELKRPYLRFFLWVYLNTASGMIESGAGDLPHEVDMWTYINGLNDELESITEYARTNGETVKQLLKKGPGKSEQGKGNARTQYGSIHYVLDAAMPFLQVFFRSYYQPDRENFPQEADYVDTVATSLMSATNALAPLISDGSHMKAVVSCMNVVLSASTLPVKVMEDFQEKYGSNMKIQDIRSDARRKYEEYFEHEEELNNQLNVFAINYSAAYGGFNDVQTQIGFPSNAEYTDIGGDEELPLGHEFQDHVHCFINHHQKNPHQKYMMAGKVVQQLSISASYTHFNEKERLNQEELDIKCLQLLRAIIHNEIVKMPGDWENNPKLNRRQLMRIKDVQDALNAHDAMLKVLPHLSKTGDDIVREVLAFLASILFGGNEEVQNSLIEYFLGTREEKFFFAIKTRMQLSAIATKEKRSLLAQHQAKIEEAIQQAKALRKALKTGKLAAQEIMASNPMGSSILSNLDMNLKKSSSRLSLGGGSKKGKSSSAALKSRYGSRNRLGSQISLSRSNSHLNVSENTSLMPKSGNDIQMKLLNKKDEKSVVKLKDNKIAPADPPEVTIEDIDDEELERHAYLSMFETDELDYRDDGYIALLLKIMGLMCDGQNGKLQDYLREQPDNIKSVNLIAETSRFLSLLYTSINSQTLSLVNEVFNTLVEFTSGNIQNQIVVFDNKICDYINYILRGAQYQGCNAMDVLELKKTIATLITALTEESPKKPTDPALQLKLADTGEDVAESLDVDSVWQVAVDCYQKTQSREGAAVTGELRNTYLDVGYHYFHLLLRVRDLQVKDRVCAFEKGKIPHEVMAWKFYTSGTMSIEILKNDELQKIYFRCKDKSVLREDVKEKFKYEVDRSTPSNKLREFMDWSKDIIKDIKYTRRIMANPLLSFFVKNWWNFNMGMLVISCIFFILIMVTWREPLLPDGTSDYAEWRPRLAYAPDAILYLTYTLGGLHNLFSFCVLVIYFVTNHPTFPRCQAIRRKLSLRKSHDEDPDDDDEEQRESHLEIKFFSFQTFWYSLLFVCSILGTVSYGYFFSFHLLHMAYFNQLLRRAIQAVTKNGHSLFWVFFYGLIILNIYALWSFAFYRDIYNSDIGDYCTTFYECMVTAVHRGLIDGMYPFLEVPDGKPFEFHLHKAVFDVTFFIIITTIGLNIIFGIIVDTFSELRDNKWQVDNDMHTTCFICSRKSYDFEHQAGGFEQHVRCEHNQWAYLFFFIHLDETRSNDYTALELYVSRLLNKENYDFFPLNRALSLQKEEDSNELRLETLMTQVTYLVSKIKEEAATKEQELERKRQKEWELKHRHVDKP